MNIFCRTYDDKGKCGGIGLEYVQEASPTQMATSSMMPLALILGWWGKPEEGALRL